MCLHSRHSPAELISTSNSDDSAEDAIRRSFTQSRHHGTPKLAGNQKSAHVTQNLEDEQKKLGGSENFSGDAKKFPRNTKVFSCQNLECRSCGVRVGIAG